MVQLKATNKEQGDYILLDQDTYDAAYQRYEEFTGTYGPALKLFFNVVYADEHGKTAYTDVSGIASVPEGGVLGTKSKLRQWIEAIMGRALADGEAPDLEALSNTPCRLVLGIKDGDTREDGTKAQFNKIEKILPPRKRTTKPAVQEDLV